MIGRSFVTAQKTRGTGVGRGSISLALAERRHAMGPPLGHVRAFRRRTSRASARRRRSFAFVTEHLEARSVPSGFAGVSLSALTSAVQSTVDSAALLVHDVATSSSLAGPGAALAPGATAPISLIEGAGPAATGAMFDAVDSVSKGVDSALVPVIARIDVSAGSESSAPGVAASDVADTSPSAGGSATVSVSVALPPIVPPVSNVVTGLVGPLDDTLAARDGGTAAGSEGDGAGMSIAAGSGLVGTALSAAVANQGGAGASAGASQAPVTGSTAGALAQTGGSAGGAQSAAFASNGGSAASLGVLGYAAAPEAASATTGPSLPATVSGPAGDGAVTGQGRLEDEPTRAESSSLGAGRPAGPEIEPAELLAGDLESLERALAQLMRRFDGLGQDLAGWFAELGTHEMLVAAGMVALAGEVFRRWERRRRLAIPPTRAGASGRPGPFYRPKADPFGRPGSGRRVDRPALI
jgi:hypothetical protein